MSSAPSLTVNVSGLSGTFQIEAPEGATAADVRELAGISDGLQLRADGSAVSDEDSYEVRDGQTLVTTPPAGKHGSL